MAVASKPEKQFLSVKEAASMLCVSTWTIYRLVASKKSKFPVKRFGPKDALRIPHKDLLEWIEGR